MHMALEGCPSDPQAFKHCSVSLSNGHIYHYIDEPSAAAVPHRGTCLLLHGFPDLWYGWRYQIVALTKAGFRCIAPSCLGYGESSKPDDLAAYGFKALSQDLQELLKIIEVKGKILLFGHDWGGVLAWRFAAYYPQSVKAIAVLSTPYAPPAQTRDQWTDLETLVQTRLANFGYQLFFASEEAPKLIQQNLAPFLGFIFADGTATRSDASWTRAGVLKAKLHQIDSLRKLGGFNNAGNKTKSMDFQYYLDSFQKHGMRHPLMWYRTRRICFQEEIDSKLPLRFPAGIPALFVTGENDEALPLAMSEHSANFFAKGQYQRIVLQGADHWLLQRPSHRDAVASILCDWVSRVGASNAKM